MTTISENGIKILDYLKENNDKNLTAKDIANALDIKTAVVNGTFNGLANKGLGARVEGTVPAEVEISYLTITDAGYEADISELSENCKAIMEYLKSIGNRNVTADEAAEALDINKKSFIGAFNSLVKKEFADRIPAKVMGETTVNYLVLTEAGLNFDPEAGEN